MVGITLILMKFSKVEIGTGTFRPPPPGKAEPPSKRAKVDDVYTVRNNLLQRMNTVKYRYVAIYKGKRNILRHL